MKKGRITAIVSILLALLFSMGYHAQNVQGQNTRNENTVQTVTPIPTTVPTPSPTPEPIPETQFDFARSEAEIRNVLYDLLNVDAVTKVNPDTHFIAEGKEPAFADQLKRIDEYKAIDISLAYDAEELCTYASEALQDIFPDSVVAYRIEKETAGWKYIASLLWLLPEEYSCRDLYDVHLITEKMDSSAYAQTLSLCVSIRPKPYLDLLYALSDGNRDHYMAAEYIMAYGTTIYDEDGNVIPYTMPELTEEYIALMHKPLAGRPVFYDRWYQGRSKNTRLHTGLDMHARKNAKIYSCTDGTVLYYGYRDTPGYYVIVRDDEGYEYHYYHMSKASDFLTEGQTVKAGDVIGYVGNTGNSDLNHLHLALISPDCRYVRLYSIMKDMYRKR